MMRLALGLIVLAFSLGASADASAGHAPPVKSGVAGFDVYRDGKTLHLLSAEFDDARQSRQLLHRRSDDNGRSWTQAVRVNGDRNAVYDIVRGNDPQLAARGDALVAVWTAKGTGYGGSGPLVTAVSRDGGRSWRPGARPSDTTSSAGEGYVDVIAGAGGFDLVWLDGRDGTQGLRHAHSRDGAKWSTNTTVQKATCECCWNTLARSGDDLLVMVRGKGPRDMLLFARTRDERWNKTATVGAFGWDYKGCPHTGGSLAATAGAAKPLVHSVVWTGAAGAEGLHYLRSSDSGRSWTTPQRVGSTGARRADVAGRGAGAVLVVWDQFEAAVDAQPAHTGIYAMESRDGGQRWWKPVRLSRSGVEASYPRAVETDDGFLVLWTESIAGGAPVLRTEFFRQPR